MSMENEIAELLARIHVVPDAEADARVEAQQKASRRTRSKELMIASGAPLRHLKATLNPSGIWGAKLEMLKKRIGTGTLSLLIGGRGVGKTQLAVELMKQAAEMNLQPLYCTGTSIGLDLRESFKKESRVSEKDIIAKYVSPRLLVVDEWGKAKESDYMTAIFFEILDRRYAQMRDTIMISNHTGKEALSELGASLLSRVQECGLVAELSNPSFREGGVL